MEETIKRLEAAARAAWENTEYRSDMKERFPNQHPTFDSPFVPSGEPVEGKTYRADGWAYFDPPTRFSPEMWELFLNAFGVESTDYVVLAVSAGNSPEGSWVRGQILVSPDGIKKALVSAAEMRKQ